MSNLIVASGLPAAISSGIASNVPFGPVLNVPEDTTNVPINVRASGSIVLPAGDYSGYFGIGLAADDDNSTNIFGCGVGKRVVVDGPQRILPFRISAWVVCDPFLGVLMDLNAPASRLVGTFAKSGASCGDSINNEGISAYGGGSQSFASEFPLTVVADLFKDSSSPNPMPMISALLTQFELEF